MSRPPDHFWELSKTLTLCEYIAPENWHYLTGNYGFWLYDETRGMNLSIRAKTAEAAFVKALTYYQKRLLEVEKAHNELTQKVDAFVSQFVEPEELE
jgi:hypothetical protein